MASLEIMTDKNNGGFSSIKITFRDIEFYPYKIRFVCNSRQASDLIIKMCMNPIFYELSNIEMYCIDKRTTIVEIQSKHRFIIKDNLLEVNNER